MLTIFLLLIVGTILVFLETVLVGGVWAIMGVACYAGAVWFAYDAFGVWAAAAAGIVSAAMCVSAFLAWLYVIPKTSFGKKLYLNSKQDGRAPAPDFSKLVGKNAVALTPLSPTGKAEIDGVPYDARCETSSADAGDALKVTGASAFELKVRKI